MASTYPLEIVEAARWSKANPEVKGDAVAGAVQKETWDPSVKSLCAFPTVLANMNDKIDWTQKLGDAFLAQQKEVMQAVQILRGKAKETGNLKSTKEVTVKEEPAPAGSPAPQTIIIESPDPEVVYVPSYNPTVVYGAWSYPYYPPYAYYPPAYYGGAMFWSFTAGVIVGGAIWGNCNWGGNDVDIDINRQNNFNKNEINANRNNINSGNRTGNTATAPATTARAPSRAGSTTPNIARESVTRIRPRSRNTAGARNQQAAQSREQYRGHAEQGRQQIRAKAPATSATWRATASARATWAARRRRDLSGGTRDMGGNNAGTRDMGGASTRDLGGARSEPRHGGARTGRQFGIASSSSAFGGPTEQRREHTLVQQPRRHVARRRRNVTWWRRTAPMKQGNYAMRATVLIVITCLAALTACAEEAAEFQNTRSRGAGADQGGASRRTRARCSGCSARRPNRSSIPATRLRTRTRATTFSRPTRRRIRSTRVTRTTSRSKWVKTSGPSRFRSSTEGGKWYFDSPTGVDELINRRVGANELATIQSCLAYADAQREYYMSNAQKDPMQHFADGSSAPTERRTACTGPPARTRNRVLSARDSPRRARKATAETGTMKGAPFHGYIYRMLTKQGRERARRRV